MITNQQINIFHPTAFCLENRVSPELSALLLANGWIAADEKIESVQKPGEGNMNVVVRVITDRRAFILKQSRPWVAKYPQVAAPIERIGVEAKFYRQIAQHQNLTAFVPMLIGYDAANFLLALEDLGAGTDFTFLYQPGRSLESAELQSLMQFLSALHAVRPENEVHRFPENRAMRLLNHEHIFSFPFRHNTGFDLDTVQPGLQALSLPYKNDAALTARITRLGEVYLQPGTALIHGDYYPGSWLKTATGTRIIDPEFGFLGRPEFDLGVLLAHLKLAQQPNDAQQQVMAQYRQSVELDPALLRAFAGVEILRRLLGLAQLPASPDLTQKKALLKEAARLVLEYGV